MQFSLRRAHAALSLALLGTPALGQITGTDPTYSLASGEAIYSYFDISGTLSQTGGLLRSTDGLYVGDIHSGSYNLSGGTVEAGSLVVSRAGTMVQTGGTVTTGTFHVGLRENGTSSYRMQGGSLTAGAFTIGGSPGSNARVFLHSGTLTAAYLVKGGTQAGTAEIYFLGGTLRAGGDHINYLSSNLTTYVSSGGFIFDTNGFAVDLYNTLLHLDEPTVPIDGGLTKQGAGTLRLGVANHYTGATTL